MRATRGHLRVAQRPVHFPVFVELVAELAIRSPGFGGLIEPAISERQPAEEVPVWAFTQRKPSLLLEQNTNRHGERERASEPHQGRLEAAQSMSAHAYEDDRGEE